MLSRLCPLALLLAAPLSAQFQFVEVTQERGLDAVLNSAPGPGTAVGDIDSDGWPDLVYFGLRNQRPVIYRNNGAAVQAGTSNRWFVDISRDVLQNICPPSSMGLLADVDNDGDPDLIFSRLHIDPATGEYTPNRTSMHYLENRVPQGGRFVDVGTNDPNAGYSETRTTGMTMADCDNDGDLDLVYLHNGGNAALIGGPGFYFRNEGGGQFSDQTALFGADLFENNRHFTPALVDFSGDMLPDLHVSIDFYQDKHCLNLGGGMFQDVSQAAGTTSTNADMGLAVGDIDNDGDMDMYSTNINIGVLYVNNGAGHFTDEAATRGVFSWGSSTTIGWGTAFGDLDMDRDQDLCFVAYGNAPGHIYENDGTGHFTDRTALNPELFMRGHGLIPFDYDMDGDLDLLVMRSGPSTPSLYENQAEQSGQHWLQITLRGTTSNREGIGARIEATFQDGLKQTQFVKAGTSFRSALPSKVHFGMGSHTEVRRLVVTWPSGQVTEMASVPADQHMLIVE
ncbi:MAG: hypothetical protein ACI8QC_001766 [Planctomycetota bacterium]|jgi:hypothetical protein